MERKEHILQTYWTDFLEHDWAGMGSFNRVHNNNNNNATNYLVRNKMTSPNTQLCAEVLSQIAGSQNNSNSSSTMGDEEIDSPTSESKQISSSRRNQQQNRKRPFNHTMDEPDNTNNNNEQNGKSNKRLMTTSSTNSSSNTLPFLSSSHISNNETGSSSHNNNSNNKHVSSANIQTTTSSSPNEDRENSTVRCKCKKSRCLKMYCDCFAAQKNCVDGECRCEDCYNNEEHAKERDEVISNLLIKRPSAFQTKTVLPLTVEASVTLNAAATNKSSSSNKTIGNHHHGSPMMGSTSLADGTTSTTAGAAAGAAAANGNGPMQPLLVIAHARGCTCRKSNCLKRYCVCFNTDTRCGSWCKCVACKNMGLTVVHTASSPTVKLITSQMATTSTIPMTIPPPQPSIFTSTAATATTTTTNISSSQQSQPILPPIPVVTNIDNLERSPSPTTAHLDLLADITTLHTT
jgi:hypothetical protein